MLLIGLGTNDSKKVNWSHKDDFVNNYKEIITGFTKQNPKLKVYCLLPIPSQEAREGGSAGNALKRKSFRSSGSGQERKSRVIDLNKVMKDKGSLLVDGVHPNAEEHALMAEHILLVLKGKAAEKQQAAPVPERQGLLYELEGVKETGWTLRIRRSRNSLFALSVPCAPWPFTFPIRLLSGRRDSFTGASFFFSVR